MILLDKSNDANKVILSLSEKSILTNPYWLFAIWSKEENQFTYFLGTDLSDQTDAYNYFIIDGTTYSLGEYDYYVYEQTADVVLNPPVTNQTLVEQGFMRVYDSTIVTIPSYTPDVTEIPVYRG